VVRSHEADFIRNRAGHSFCALPPVVAAHGGVSRTVRVERGGHLGSADSA